MYYSIYFESTFKYYFYKIYNFLRRFHILKEIYVTVDMPERINKTIGVNK